MDNDAIKNILEALKKEFPDMTWSLNEQSMTILAEKGHFYFRVCYRGIRADMLLDCMKYNLYELRREMEEEKLS